MKKIIVYITLSIVVLNLSNTIVRAQAELKGRISISGAFALYPLGVKWAEEFKKIHPKVQIDISAGGAGKGITDVLNNMVEIGMVSREIYAEETKKGAVGFAVAKDAVLAVISASNPNAKDILSKGLKKDAGNNIWITGKYKTFAQAFSIPAKTPIHIYTRSDACGAAEVWAKFYGKKQEDLLGSGVYGDPGLALAVKKDALGIGFNNIAYAYDHKTKKQLPGLIVVPIDVNNNGKIDPEESFYDTLDDLINAIGEGKYPSPPARELFFVTKGKPQNEVLKEFLRWSLTDGQKYVRESGYINLPKEKIENEKKKL
jgi:phosphate transport system substrate-binding protein